MSKIQKILFTSIFAVSLLCYFVSEQILRSITVSSMSKKMDTNAIISKLPAGIRDAVNHKIAVQKAQNELSKAETDLDRTTALNKLAGLSGDGELRDKYYGEIINKYASLPQAFSAFRHFYYEKTKKNNISTSKYHTFIKILEPMDQYSAWSSGLAKLESKKATNEEIITFLKPLLDKTPDFRDYHGLYAKFSTYSIKVKDSSIYDIIEKKKQSCLDKKLIEEVLSEIEEAEKKKKKKSKKKKSKKKKSTTK